MADIISIGTVTIDLYYKGESLTQTKDHFELAIGGKYFANYFYQGLGGGGANVAIGIEKNGLQAALIATIGKNGFKKLICESLDEAKVTYKDYCQFEEEYTNISSVLLTEKGEKTIINYRTPHQHIFEKEADFEILKRAKAIYMANLASVSLAERVSVLRYAKNNNIMTFANLNVTDARRPIEQIVQILKYVDVFMINTYEFADIVKTPYRSIDFHSKITNKFQLFSPEQLLVITDGSKGSYAYYQHKVYYQPAIKDVKVVDTTGAGDAFTAGFIAEYVKSDRNIESSMNNGAEYAVKILRKLGSN
ncbi:MAG TPA: carbohydrate kinase family protein [Candidatus Woesebacteria bacterium]|nr:carbohydrate kinase family protein [Candidatus Woesebacteria bacterium]